MCFEATSHYSWTIPKISSFDDTAREEEAEYLEVVFTPSIYIFTKIHVNLCAGAARGHPQPDPAAEPRQQGAADLRHLHHPAQAQAAGHSGGHELVMHCVPCTVYCALCVLCTVVMLVVNIYPQDVYLYPCTYTYYILLYDSSVVQ